RSGHSRGATAIGGERPRPRRDRRIEKGLAQQPQRQGERGGAEEDGSQVREDEEQKEDRQKEDSEEESKEENGEEEGAHARRRRETDPKAVEGNITRCARRRAEGRPARLDRK